MKNTTKQFNTHFNFAILAIITVGFLLWHSIAIFNLEQDLKALQLTSSVISRTSVIPAQAGVQNDAQISPQGRDDTDTDTDTQILYNEDGSIDTSNWKTFENQNFKVKFPHFFSVKIKDPVEVSMKKDSFLFLQTVDNFNKASKIDLNISGPFEKLVEKDGYFDNWYGWAGRPGSAIGQEQIHKNILVNNITARYSDIRGYGFQNQLTEKHVQARISFPNESKMYSVEISGLVKEKDFNPFYENILFVIAETFEFKI